MEVARQRQESASLVAADGHLYVHYADGTMSLIKASPEKLEEVSHFKLPSSGDRPGWSHPVILDGKLFVREGDVIVCYELKADGSTGGVAAGSEE
ncbi:MAG: hypothetical protein U1D30_04350 [Planctomycetota bacterium]